MRVPALAAAASLVLVTVSATACSAGPTSTAATGASPAAAAGSSSDAGGGAPGGAAAAPVDVCKLLTAARASAIVGVHYASAHSSPNMCSYTPTNAPIGMFVIVFQGFQGAGAPAWKSELSTLQEDGGATPQTISGVGDRAAAAGLELGAQAGVRIIDVHGGDPSGDTKFTKSAAIAKAVIAALH
jgi:hypothetical protein